MEVDRYVRCSPSAHVGKVDVDVPCLNIGTIPHKLSNCVSQYLHFLKSITINVAKDMLFNKDYSYSSLLKQTQYMKKYYN